MDNGRAFDCSWNQLTRQAEGEGGLLVANPLHLRGLHPQQALPSPAFATGRRPTPWAQSRQDVQSTGLQDRTGCFSF